jgi:4-diphosphocytidyl-2-C-methyl-D-erythritol kinase
VLHFNSFDAPPGGNQISIAMLTEPRSIEVPCAAKVNLSLAVLGPRGDGFHALYSIVAQTDLADRLEVAWDPAGAPDGDSVVIRGARLPAEDNSVRQALRAFRGAAGLRHGAIHACLDKRIPVGAGLGGGSSDAVGALQALRALAPAGEAAVDWTALAAGLGSDCPLFLSDQPVLMEGRGERITPLAAELAGRLRGRSLVLFKPRFGVDTAQAYRRLARGEFYTPAEQAGEILEAWIRSGDPLPPRHNDFERLMAHWMPSLAIVLQRLRDRHGLDARLSGSGSACFVVADAPDEVSLAVDGEVRRAWGEAHWIVSAKCK